MFIPKFTLNYAMVKALAKAEAANQLGFSALIPPTWQKKWVTKAVSWSVSANVAMDGSPLNHEQVEKIVVREPQRDDSGQYLAIQAGVESSPEAAQEVINFYHALKYVEANRNNQLEFNDKFLLDLHALITERTIPLNQVGAWRNAKLVIRQGTGGEVVFTPPSPIEIKYQLADLWQWLSGPTAKELPVLIKGAICWAELSRIYPFAVANGRVTRALVRLILSKEGFYLPDLLPYEQDFLENRSVYYQALVSSIKEGDYSAWIEFYLNSWATQAQGFFDQLNSKDMKSSLAVVHQPLPLRERQIKLLEYLKSNPWDSIPNMRELFPDISDDSILRDLKDLMTKKLVKKRGKTKAARYALKGGSW